MKKKPPTNKTLTLHQKIKRLYSHLLKNHGWRNWWPNATKFEIIVGAILVQNTNWNNVDKSLRLLKKHRLLTIKAITNLSHSQLIKYIKPSGLYNQKSKYLKIFASWYIAEGGFKKLNKLDTLTLRKKLLAVKGIGKETADVILLYVFHRPIFVIDNYTRRLLKELDIVTTKLPYDELQLLFHEAIRPDREVYSEYHALIVYHSKVQKNPKYVSPRDSKGLA